MNERMEIFKEKLLDAAYPFRNPFENASPAAKEYVDEINGFIEQLHGIGRQMLVVASKADADPGLTAGERYEIVRAIKQITGPPPGDG